MARIVLGSYMVRYPLGGMLSWALQWLVGLHELGHDVYFVEKADYENACFDPRSGSMTDDGSYGMAVLRDLLEPWELHRRICFVDFRGVHHGMEREAIARIFATADLFIDMGTHGALLEEAAGAQLRVLVESEPAYTQMKLQSALDQGHPLPSYDAFYTNGLNIGTAASSVPTAAVRWGYVMNPVVPSLYRVVPPPVGAPFTTVMNWQSHAPIEYRGNHYGQKDIEFQRFKTLPRMVQARMEVAVAGSAAPVDELLALGWRVRNAHEVTASVRSYRDYLESSMGEFGVCKNVFVATHSGWFSERSAAYLASGRPVVLQATGFEEHLPCGRGLFAVRDVDEAAEAIGRVCRDYGTHSAAARKLAVEELNAARVLAGFLRELGIG